MKWLLWMGMGLLMACQGGSYRDQNVQMKAVTDFDPGQYLGRWYEIARYPNSFEKDCVATKAEYGLLSDVEAEDIEISVLNSCHMGDVNGALKEARGKAVYVGEGMFKVTFLPFYLPGGANYWVLGVRDYEVAVVGEPSGSTGWILARAPAISQADIEWAQGVFLENGYALEALVMVPQINEN